jgi:hypothetical protein
VRALDRALLDRVDDAERGDDLARSEDPDLELSARQLLDSFGDDFTAAVDRVERLGEARCTTPANRG